MCLQLEISARQRGSLAPCGTRYVHARVTHGELHTKEGKVKLVDNPRGLVTEFCGGGWKPSWPALLTIKNQVFVLSICLSTHCSECGHGTVMVLWVKPAQFPLPDEAVDPSSADGMVCSKVHGSRCFRGIYWYGFQLWTICPHYKIFQLQGQYSLIVVNHWVTHTACLYSLTDTEQMLWENRFLYTVINPSL